jgi:glutamate N-acetyltransferase/amino-acid N-acetyltransferase
VSATVTVDRGLGVDAAAGFSATGVACGIKPAGELDLALVVGAPGTVAAGAFTTNVVVAAPVVWSRARLAASPDARVVVVNSGNANACTGPAGHRAVRTTAERAAAELGCLPEQVLVCSTGVIGVPLDAGRVGDGVAKAAASLGAHLDPDGGSPPRASDGRAAAEAIRTTDTVAKQAGAVLPGGVTVGGMAKGAAMLAPALATTHATMLAVLTTDALADPAALRYGLATAVEESFNRITVDGAQSTNDTVLLLASGASGVAADPDGLAGAVRAVCDDLATQMLADAEGGTKVIRVEVGGAGSAAAALAVARRVADSPLVKAAAYGGDPNWGRVLQAAGTAGVAFDQEAVRLELRGAAPGGAAPVVLLRNGAPTGADGSAAMAAPEIGFRLHLGGPGPWACVRTADLTPEYVRLNSESTT